jgi:hypothetical protein
LRPELKIRSVVIDCLNFDKMLTFWQETLHYVPMEPAKDGWVVLRDPAGRNVNVSLNQVSERLMGRNWLHLDLYTNDKDGEVERLLKLGATRHSQTYDPDDDFIVLENPMATFSALLTQASPDVGYSVSRFVLDSVARIGFKIKMGSNHQLSSPSLSSEFCNNRRRK